MELVQVKIRATVVTHKYGTLTSGDILRTSAEFAKHLVEDCDAADYMTPSILPDEPAKPRKRKAE